jgi:TRAP-type C4-dicarboxylate transport system permease large subunit
VFSPVEASGIGAGIVLVLAFVQRRLNWHGFKEAGMGTLQTSSILYMIVIGANILNPFFSVTHIPQTLGAGLG